jgi:hypothetical protein
MGDLGIHHDVEIGFAERRDVRGSRRHRRDDMDVDADLIEQPGQLCDIVAVAESRALWDPSRLARGRRPSAAAASAILPISGVRRAGLRRMRPASARTS